MSYIIPEATRNQWKALAQSSGLPYATIVGQHVYDLQGLVKVLQEQVAQAEASQPATTPPAHNSDHKKAELERKLHEAQEQLAAYQLEQQHPTD